MIDKLDRQVVKHKECVQAHHNVEPLKRQVAA